jgi:hypothetical protein
MSAIRQRLSRSHILDAILFALHAEQLRHEISAATETDSR